MNRLRFTFIAAHVGSRVGAWKLLREDAIPLDQSRNQHQDYWHRLVNPYVSGGRMAVRMAQHMDSELEIKGCVPKDMRKSLFSTIIWKRPDSEDAR
jgi:hypothetical protein